MAPTVGFLASYLILWGIVVFLLLLAIGLLRELGTLRQKLGTGFSPEKLTIGTRAPAFSLLNFRSNTLESSAIFGRQRTCLIFLSSTCAVCRRFAKDLGSLPEHLRRTIIVICFADKEGCTRIAALLDPGVPLLLDASGETSSRYGVIGYPTLILLTEDGRITQYAFPRTVNDLADTINNHQPSGDLTTTFLEEVGQVS